jgi:hypothetical protein
VLVHLEATGGAKRQAGRLGERELRPHADGEEDQVGGQAPPVAAPSLTVDRPHRHWTAGGRVTALDRAHERVSGVVSAHRPPALPPALDAELRRLAHVG